MTHDKNRDIYARFERQEKLLQRLAQTLANVMARVEELEKVGRRPSAPRPQIRNSKFKLRKSLK